MSEFVTLGKFFNGIEAHQIKNLLDQEHIQCLIQNEISSQVYNFHTPSDGGVLIKVHRSDLQKALSILNYQSQEDKILEEDWHVKTNPEPEQPFKNRRKQRFIWLWLLAIIVLLLTIKYLS